jgi:hypothetical protein
MEVIVTVSEWQGSAHGMVRPGCPQGMPALRLNPNEQVQCHEDRKPDRQAAKS